MKTTIDPVFSARLPQKRASRNGYQVAFGAALLVWAASCSSTAQKPGTTANESSVGAAPKQAAELVAPPELLLDAVVPNLDQTVETLAKFLREAQAPTAGAPHLLRSFLDGIDLGKPLRVAMFEAEQDAQVVAVGTVTDAEALAALLAKNPRL